MIGEPDNQIDLRRAGGIKGGDPNLGSRNI